MECFLGMMVTLALKLQVMMIAAALGSVLCALAFCLRFVSASPPQFQLIVVFWTSSCNQKYIIDGGVSRGALFTVLVLELAWFYWQTDADIVAYPTSLSPAISRGVKVKLHVACDWENLIFT